MAEAVGFGFKSFLKPETFHVGFDFPFSSSHEDWNKNKRLRVKAHSISFVCLCEQVLLSRRQAKGKIGISCCSNIQCLRSNDSINHPNFSSKTNMDNLTLRKKCCTKNADWREEKVEYNVPLHVRSIVCRGREWFCGFQSLKCRDCRVLSELVWCRE